MRKLYSKRNGTLRKVNVLVGVLFLLSIVAAPISGVTSDALAHGKKKRVSTDDSDKKDRASNPCQQSSGSGKNANASEAGKHADGKKAK